MNIQTWPYTRPSKGTATERVWEIADALTRQQGYKAKRAQVIDAYVQEGGNRNTASTQYYYWSQQASGNGDSGEGTGEKHQTGVIQLTIEPNGRLLIPLELRRLMKLGDTGRVSARVVDGELRLVSPMVALQKLQREAATMDLNGKSVVEEFIKEKREESSRE